MHMFALMIFSIKVGDVVEAQRRRIVSMLLKGKIYGLPLSDGTVSSDSSSNSLCSLDAQIVYVV